METREQPPNRVDGIISAVGRKASGPPTPDAQSEPNRQASTNLPRPLTSFVGRAWELSEVRERLRETRLLTLTGSGGCGKSRLAVQVATDALADFPDGAWWVELAPIGDPELMVPAIAQLFGVRPLPGQTELDAVVSFLSTRQALVVLDNCEHLLEHAARVADALARGSTSVRVLATSREPLRVQGETEWRVPPLSLAPPENGEPAVASDGMQLFVERARQVNRTFRLTNENLPVIEAVCRELDGIPLAIELAAARLRAFSVEQIADRLADRFPLLAAGERTALPHHQTLRASVEWSHELLTDQERSVFRRLAVFQGGFTLEAAERIGAGTGIERRAVLGVVAALVDKSLVQKEERGGSVRYRLLETVRQYALEHLEAVGEAERTRDRHRDFYLDLAERIAPELLTPRQPEFLARLDPEAANLTVAIDRAAATEPEKALRLSVALTFWWRMRSLFTQGERSLVRALEAATEPSALRARALWGRAFLLTFAGVWGEALPAAQQALDAAEEAGDDATLARALRLLGMATMWPDPIASRPQLERARELAAGSRDDIALMHATQALGMSYVFQEDIRAAMPFHAEALRLAERLGQQDIVAFYWAAIAVGAWVSADRAALLEAAQGALAAGRRSGDVVAESIGVCGFALSDIDAGQPQRAVEHLDAAREHVLAKGNAFMLPALDLAVSVANAAEGRLDEARSGLMTLIGHGAAGWAMVLAWAHVFLAEVQRLLGDSRGARSTANDGFALAQRTGNRPRAAEAQMVLGRLAAACGEWTEAQRLHHDALLMAVERGTPRLPRVLEALAEVAAGLESRAEAARILGAAKRQWRELGIVPWPHQRLEAEELEASLRQALGDEAFPMALAEGESLTREEAVAYVRRARGERKRPSAGWESLTPTELEVARHTAAGLTNVEIAERMFISHTTVRTHLTHIFAKLRLKNRAQLSREFARRADVDS